MASRGQWTAVGVLVAGFAGLIATGMVLTSEIALIGPGAQAPDFSAVDVHTGDLVTLADYAGEIVLLNIWATWCKPCEEEMPSMQRLSDTLGLDGLKVVAVSIDQADSDHVRDWVDQRSLTFDVLHDRSGRIERLYQTTEVPESFVINDDGLIVKKEIGAREWDHPVQIAMFRSLVSTVKRARFVDDR